MEYITASDILRRQEVFKRKWNESFEELRKEVIKDICKQLSLLIKENEMATVKKAVLKKITKKTIVKKAVKKNNKK